MLLADVSVWEHVQMRVANVDPVVQKFDGSRRRGYPGRPRVSPEIEALVVRFARENRGWGYDRIVGALANLGHPVSDQTVGNVLRRHYLAPAAGANSHDDREGVHPVACGRARRR
jgi:hypothetical protein